MVFSRTPLGSEHTRPGLSLQSLCAGVGEVALRAPLVAEPGRSRLRGRQRAGRAGGWSRGGRRSGGAPKYCPPPGISAPSVASGPFCPPAATGGTTGWLCPGPAHPWSCRRRRGHPECAAPGQGKAKSRLPRAQAPTPIPAASVVGGGTWGRTPRRLGTGQVQAQAGAPGPRTNPEGHTTFARPG